MKNIKIIGTSHISHQSVSEVKKIIEEWFPDIVAIELDPARLYSLFHKKTNLKLSNARQLGLFGYLFAVLGSYLQNKLGNSIGMSPGVDMKNAILAAKEAKAKVALIDQPINITLQKLSRNVSFWEKAHLFFYIIYLGLFPERNKTLKQIDLRKVPSEDIIYKLLEELKNKFPEIYKVLISSRNKLMVRNIKLLQQKNPDSKILIVVGAGHLAGIKKLLN